VCITCVAAAHSQGWDLHDILGQPRVQDTANQYVDPATGLPMIQNYTSCRWGLHGHVDDRLHQFVMS
jgi:hypothetical protein